MAGRRIVAVVGGGASGVLASVAILRRTDAEVVLIEPDEPGGGVAYGAAARPWHLLNSRAGAMSAYPDDPGHFARWAGVENCDFVSRQGYGRYLREVLDWAAAAHPGRFRWLPGRAVDVRSDPRVILADGREVRADDVVLALGGPAGTQPGRADHPFYVPDPWRPGALEGLPGNDGPIVLVGTGLTAVDVALTLTGGSERADRVSPVGDLDAGPGAFWDGPSRSAPEREWIGFAPSDRVIIAYSRHGLLPLTHVERPAELAPPDVARRAGLREVVRAVREAAAGTTDWRTVVDGLRPQVNGIWERLGERDREAFLRHLARVWECHRHRMAPRVAERIAHLRETGRLIVRKGAPEVTPAAIVNCAGPGRLPEAATGLTAALLRTGLARVGPHQLGLDVDRAGRIQPHVWVLGPLRRGVSWETTAVPEIRTQASELAEEIAVQHPDSVITQTYDAPRIPGQVWFDGDRGNIV